jgi:hypothetical protein
MLLHQLPAELLQIISACLTDDSAWTNFMRTCKAMYAVVSAKDKRVRREHKWQRLSDCALIKKGDLEGLKFKIANLQQQQQQQQHHSRPLNLRYMFLMAVRQGQVPIAKYLHDACGVSVEDMEEVGALNAAAGFGHLSLVQYLMQEVGLAPNAHTIEDACMGNFTNVSVVRFLLASGVPCSPNCLHMANYDGQLDMVKFLIQEVGLVPTRQELDDACMDGYLKLIQFYMQEMDMDSPYAMDLACAYGNLHVVQFLHGLGKTCSHDTMLLTVENEHWDVVHFLHENADDGWPAAQALCMSCPFIDEEAANAADDEDEAEDEAEDDDEELD